ncbi:putative ABC exporter domain-containing protein [Diplocloster agilis]|uniref:putative ABC exporter domain-containing protein n=1 Tax=Diplocloster agilis TaxID=2850323 RepID=UPI0008208BD0|nr:putative ABC exporter domain-containing protein [Suonthocola fibrivorans]MCU6736946.1 putative ABC exporter domain-containing protein [Suonthocola fibrivorans]SCJ94632.1 Uncharacterised protein [uncultured Clostridium sp.]
MKSLIYLWKRTMVNRIRKALSKPVTYIYIILGIAYVAMILTGIGSLVMANNWNTPIYLVYALSALVFLSIPSSLLQYAKRKGLLFRQSEVHFLFSAPISPKLILLYEQMKSNMMNLVLTLVVTVLGCTLFGIPVWKMLLYFVLAYVVENVLEAGLVVVLYGNERLKERTVRLLCRAVWLVVAVLVLFAAYMFFTQEASWNVLPLVLDHPFLQCIPIIGWNIAFIRLLILGPTVLNVVCTLLYVVFALLLLVISIRMRCAGDYYEDAMKFADDYQEIMQKKKKGETSGVSIGKKKKYGKAQVEYKGSGAKAIFYRQLLEYKKNKTFIFGIFTLISLALGVGIAIFAYLNHLSASPYRFFIVPGVMAYMVFIFTSYATKWSKELENPYTYLIPDSTIRKVWYATLIEHVRSLVDGCLITIPAAVVLRLTPVQAVLTVLIYVCLQATKLYFNVLSEALLGNILGNFGKQMMRLLGEGIVIMIAVLACVAGTLLVNVEFGFFALILSSVILTGLVAWGGSIAFSKMESLQ